MTAPWATDRPALGTWVKIPAPEVVELLAMSGLDFLVIDAEHGAFDVRTTSTMISVAHGCGIRAFVRVPGHAPRDVQPALDAGAAGLFIPHVDSVEIAHDVVAACRFPPQGHRGASPFTRAGSWGTLAPAQLTEQGNTVVTVVAQLESRDAVAAADRIAEVAGIDAVFIGPYDLALAAGVAPGSDAARRYVQQAEDRCVATGSSFGSVAADGAEAGQLISRGYHFVVISNDAALLAAGARDAVAAARRGFDQPVRTALSTGGAM